MTNAEKANVIPDNALEALTRCLYPAMVAFFESDEGQREFAEWQQERKGIENLSGVIRHLFTNNTVFSIKTHPILTGALPCCLAEHITEMARRTKPETFAYIRYAQIFLIQ